jgi:ribosome biogenesis protein BRX1
MNPVKIFADSFTGEPLWENPDYVTPARHRRLLKAAAKDKYINRTEAKARYETTQPTEAFNLDKFGKQVFVDDEEEMAEKLVAEEQNEVDESESEDEEVEEKREQQNIERVKALIEKLKPGKEGRKLVKPKKFVPAGPNAGKIVKKATNKKSKMIQNIIKTKKLSTKVKKPKKN